MPVTELIVIFFSMGLIVAVVVWFQHIRADEIAHRWAQKAGLELVSAQKRYLRTGPFFYSRGQFVFRIVAQDQAGKERTGWLRVGGRLCGVLSEETKVIWD